MSNDIEKIVKQAEAKMISKQHQDAAIQAAINEAETIATQRAEAQREEKVRSFSLDVDLEDSVSTPPPSDWSTQQTAQPIEDADDNLEHKSDKKSGCLKKIIYLAVILLISLVIAYFLIVFLIDSMGLNRSSDPVDVEIPRGSGTQQIAEILAENDVIEQPLCFRIYSKLSKADGKFQQGAFTLSANMGYAEIVTTLQTSTPRANVNVTLTEGMTVEEMAKLLEEKEVCSAADFCRAVNFGTFDYDFVRDIPWGNENSGRIYRLEGYLFPDTYNFYINSTGETVVDRMLANFDKKIDVQIRQQMTEQDLTMDEMIILASLIQGEAAKKEDMEGVARVLYNRLDSPLYPRLELCSTRDYVNAVMPSIEGVEVTGSAYNTYVRSGLPVGAINNPGLDAIAAVFNPSNDEKMKQCFFFATDYDTGITHFSKTFAEHERICRQYGIGAYG